MMPAMTSMERKKPRVAVVGGSNLDYQGTSASEFIACDSNPGFITKVPGGVARNIAEACSKLRLDVSLVSAFGGDADGEFLIRSCEGLGIDVSRSLRGDFPTGRYLCLLDRNGALAGAVADMRAMDYLEPAVLEARAELFEEADCIIVDANLSKQSIAWFCDRFGRSNRRASRPLLFFDPVSETKSARARGLTGAFDCMKPNAGELSILSGAGSSKGELDIAGVEELVARLRRDGNMPGSLFVSLGHKGMYCDAPEFRGLITLPESPVRPHPVNRSGAGDVACAALAWAALSGKSALWQARCALAAAILAAAAIEPVPGNLDPTVLEDFCERLFEKESLP